MFSFTASGPKSYMIKWKEPASGDEHTEIKYKGLTLKKSNAFTPDRFMRMVLNDGQVGNGDDQIIIADPNLIRRSLQNVRIYVKDSAFKTLQVTSGYKRYFLPGNITDPNRNV
ncbi:MAG: hypothetical protein GY816_11340, partial [Cytophagales bacterium]|nr:hypothetical protein [Cytophagales bacterium]